MVDPSSCVVLISVKPKFANAIIEGVKRCEFRRTRFAQEVRFVVLYATQPVGKIVGFARVSDIKQASLDELWREFATVGGITEEEFAAYFFGKGEGIAISLEAVTRLDDVELVHLGGATRPPQSFQYLDESMMCALLDLVARRAEYSQSVPFKELNPTLQ